VRLNVEFLNQHFKDFRRETGRKCRAESEIIYAKAKTYGNPEPTAVNIGVRDRPGILISGHDLLDLEQLLEQTKGAGIDVYTHGEMLPANSYPAFKKYDNFIGNYGSAWWKQNEEFEKFNGPILMTTNCITPPRESYRNRICTT
jgi:hydroxylamine reductase